MIVLKFHEFEDYHFFLKFFLISFNRFLIFPVFKNGEIGEICIAGKGVAKGYCKNEKRISSH